MGYWYDRLGYGRPRNAELPPEPVRLPDGTGWYPATPQRYGALMSVDYAACEQTKARSMASLPFAVVNHVRDRRERLDRHPLCQLLNGMANEEMTAAQLMAWTVLRRDTMGNAHWWVEWDRGRVVGLWPVTSGVTHDYDASAPAGYRTRWYVSPGDEHVPSGWYFAHELVNITTAVTRDGFTGLSLARIAAEEIGLSVDLNRFYQSMLHNSNHHLGHLEVPASTPGNKVDPAAIANLRAALEVQAGVREAGRAPIFGYGAKWVNDSQTIQEASVIEQQRWVLEQVCRATNVPPWKVYDDNTTYAGSQQSRIDYVTDTIVPEVRQIELALGPVLRASGLPRAQAKFNLAGLMRGDDASRTQYYREMGYLGAITRADVRDLEDMEPLPGLDLPLFPLNYGTVNQDGTVNVFNADSTEPGDGLQEGVTDVPGQE